MRRIANAVAGLGLAAGLVLAPCAAPAAEAPAAGAVLLLTGQGTAASGGSIRPLAKGDAVFSGDILNTAANSFLNLRFTDGGYVLLRPDSRFQVRDFVDTHAQKSAPTPAPKIASGACGGDAGALRLDACASGQSLVLAGVGFAAGAKTLTPRGESALAPVVAALRRDPGLTAEIDAYTDSSGAPEKNLELSTARAAAVRQYLIKQGVEGARLSARGLGAQQPVADNRSAAGREANRRIELKILNAAPAATAAAPTTVPEPGQGVAQKPFTARPETAAPAPLAIAPAGPGSHAFFSLLKGGFRAVSGAIGKINHDDYQVATPVATIGIRGTDYLAVVCGPDCAHDPVIDPLLDPGIDATGGVVFGDVGGSIVITSSQGEYTLTPGHYVLVLPDGTFIPLPMAPHFLSVAPFPDPQNCSVP